MAHRLAHRRKLPPRRLGRVAGSYLEPWDTSLVKPGPDLIVQYARAFEEPDAQWTSSPVGSALSVNGLVRRRRWIRVRKRRVDMANETSQTDSSIENNDYVAAAEALISTASTNSIDANPLALREELTVYEAAIQTLLEGIKSEICVYQSTAVQCSCLMPSRGDSG